MQISLVPQSLNDLERRIHQRAIARARNYRVGEVEMLDSIDEVDRFRLYEKFRLRSTTAYCADLLNLSEDVSGAFLRVARAGRKFPELKEAIVAKKFSVWIAQRICPHMNAQNKIDWIIKAATLSKSQLEKEIARAAPGAVRDSIKPVAENRSKVIFGASDECLALIGRVREVESQRRGRTVTLEEMFFAMAEAYLHKFDPVRKAERSAGKASRRVPARKSGQRTSIPVAVRHAVNLVQRGCCQIRMPNGQICGSRNWVQLHHILEISNGGTHDPENIVTVCSAHHLQLHEDQDLTI